MNNTYKLERTQVVPRPRGEVFAFFSQASHLERLTPGFLHFRLMPPVPEALGAGTLLHYRLRLMGVPFGWTSQIERFEPGARFSDVQLRGPYAVWHHLHEFFDVEGGTLMLDMIHYRVPLGPVGMAANAVFVRRLLNRIFDYRRERIERIFGREGG